MSNYVPISGAARPPIVDSHYRYQMPALQIQHGKRNSTFIINILEIAKSLRRDGKEIVKFFGIELATSSSLKGDQASIKGTHRLPELRRTLALYIDSCVLCKCCGLPETETIVDGAMVSYRCSACGEVSSHDSTDDHAIYRFIRKNSIKKTKEEKKGKTPLLGKQDPAIMLAGFGDIENMVAIESESDDRSGVMWEENTDDATALDKSVKLYRKFLKKDWVPGDVDGAVKELINRQVSALLPSNFQVTILMRAVLRKKTHKLWKQDTKLMAPWLEHLLSRNECTSHHREALEREVLAALETVCRDKPKYFPVLALILYQLDVLMEESILKWASDLDEGKRMYPRDVVSDKKRSKIREESQPLVHWLCQDTDEENVDELV